MRRKRKKLKRMDVVEFDIESIPKPSAFIWRDLRERVKSVKNIAAIIISEKDLNSDSSDASLGRNSLTFSMLELRQ